MHAVWTNEKLGQHRPRACWPLSWHKALYKQKWDRLMRLPHLFLQDLKKIIIFLVWLQSCSSLGFPFNYIIATYKISQRIVWVMFSMFIRWMYFKSILMIKKKNIVQCQVGHTKNCVLTNNTSTFMWKVLSATKKGGFNYKIDEQTAILQLQIVVLPQSALHKYSPPCNMFIVLQSRTEIK